MKVRIGIDVGGSTTKIIGFCDNKIIAPLLIKATDPITSLFGAFGKFVYENKINIADIDKILITGVGATFINEDIYGIKTVKVSEFEANARGGLFLSKKDKALIVSLGTGTSMVQATTDTHNYVGGTAVGGGTIIGLCKKMLNISDIEKIVELAAHGDLHHIDLNVSDIVNSNLPELHNDITASNFGKLNTDASDADIALGVLNLVFQSIAMTSVFATRHSKFDEVVLIGNLSKLAICKTTFEAIHNLTGVNFTIPEMSEYATALGALLSEQ